MIASGSVTAVVDTTALALQLQQVVAQRATSVSRVGEVEKQVGVLETQRVIALRVYERTKRLVRSAGGDGAAARSSGARLQNARRADRGGARAGEDRGARCLVDATRASRRFAIRSARHASSIRSRGTVLATYVKAGEVVQPGQPLYRIANLDTLELRAYVGEAQLSQVKLGQVVRVTVDAGKGARVRSFRARCRGCRRRPSSRRRRFRRATSARISCTR